MADDNGSVEWTAQGHAVRIRYAAGVMEAMRQAAWEGLQKVPRRGLEVGGVLFGTRNGEQLQIQEWRPIVCEHAKGPGFELSAKDEEQLKKLLGSVVTDPVLRELETLGWFHSHTRDSVRLTTADLDIYNRFFPAPWQVSLVLKPHMYEPTKAGFFFREADGSVRSDSSHNEFAIEPPKKLFAGSLELEPKGIPAGAPLRAERGRRFSRLTHQMQEPAAELPVEAPPPPTPEREAFWRAALAAISGRSRVLYGIVTALVLAAPFLGLPILTPPQEEPVAFSVKEADGRLLVEWNKRAEPVLEADGGTIWITDGSITRQIRLTPDDLRTSTLSYGRQTGEVRFRLTLDKAGQSYTEHADFRGGLPSPVATSSSAEITNTNPVRTELEAEIARLRADFEREAARNQEMRRTIDNLEKRLSARRSSRSRR